MTDANTPAHFDKFVDLVELVTAKCFHGFLPPHPEIVAMAMVHCIPALRDAPEEVTQRFVDEVLPVLRMRIGLQDSAVIVARTRRPN